MHRSLTAFFFVRIIACEERVCKNEQNKLISTIKFFIKSARDLPQSLTKLQTLSSGMQK